jgi:hypothetical protein
MGIFSKKPKLAVCDMCGKADIEGCGSRDRHVDQIIGDQPSYLPSGWRAQAQGEYTFYCVRCNAYPSMKWPREGGAEAGMVIHLGVKHYVGPMKGMGPQGFEMIESRQ